MPVNDETQLDELTQPCSNPVGENNHLPSARDLLSWATFRNRVSHCS
jgi:hypothetical protein